MHMHKWYIYTRAVVWFLTDMSSHAGVEAEAPSSSGLNSAAQLGQDVTAPAKEAAEEAVKAVGRQHFTITMGCGAAPVAVCIITTEKLMVCCNSV